MPCPKDKECMNDILYQYIYIYMCMIIYIYIIYILYVTYVHETTSDVECRAHLILEPEPLNHPSLLLQKIGACSRHSLAGCQELVPAPSSTERMLQTGGAGWGIAVKPGTLNVKM